MQNALLDPLLSLPMRAFYLRHTEVSAGTDAPAGPTPTTLVNLSPKQISELSAETFRTCFTATPLHTLQAEQLTVIDADKHLSAIAHDVLNKKAMQSRAAQLKKEPTTLSGLTSKQISALSSETFRSCFAATSPRTLRPAQLAVIDADKRLSAIAHDILNEKAAPKPLAHPKLPQASGVSLHKGQRFPERQEHSNGVSPSVGVRDERQACLDPNVNANVRPQGSLQKANFHITLPTRLAIFIAQQIEEGSYRDASELISESLRCLQKQKEFRNLRLAIQRDISNGMLSS